MCVCLQGLGRNSHGQFCCAKSFLCSFPHFLPCFSSMPELASSHNLEYYIVQLKSFPWGTVFQNCLLISARKDKPETRAHGENLYLLRSRCYKTQIFLPNIGAIGLFLLFFVKSRFCLIFSQACFIVLCSLHSGCSTAGREMRGNCICFSLNQLY